MKWTTDRPKEFGWYWFKAGDNSPKEIQSSLAARILATYKMQGYKGDPNELLYVFFPAFGTISVNSLGGQFAGPIPEPEN